MSKYLPGFLTGSNEEESGITDGAVTRARAAAAAVEAAQQAGLVVPPPPIRGYGRSRSPSPHPHREDQFFPANMATASAEIAELRRVAEAAIQALAQATAGQQPRPKKPELPAFDKDNIEIWIHRVSAAYERAGVHTPKDKFAHLESKFEVGLNPKINEFLYGPATPETWEAFLSYLREEYGQTRRQEAAFMLQPLERNGMRPTQLLAMLGEKTKKISLDDIRKEKVLAALPPDVQRSMVDKVENLTAEETATLADRFFDREGRPLQPPSNGVNHVAYTRAFNEEATEEEEVNAVGFRQQRNQPPKQGGFQQKPKPPQRAAPKLEKAAPNAKALCWRHDKYGNKARFCEQGCPLFKPELAKDQAGRRA